MNEILEFITNNIGNYDEIHISYDMSKYFLSKNILNLYSGEQNIIGDTLIGNIFIKNKTINVFYNILYDFDEIEFKYKKV
jgi:hypothetical protein